MKMSEINDEKWNEICERAKGWFESHPDWKEEHADLSAVPTMMNAGDNKPTKRVAYYKAMRSMFDDIEDAPVATTGGAKSNMPLVSQNYRDATLATCKKALIAAVEDCPDILLFAVKNRRTVDKKTAVKGGLFSSAEEFAQYWVDAAYLRINKAWNAYNNGNLSADYTWSGEEDDALVSQIPKCEKTLQKLEDA